MASLYKLLETDRHHWANEEEVRKSWLKHIENATGIKFHAERGRNDASYNQVIIEFKDRGLFKGSIASASFKEAIFERLDKYIVRRAKSEGLSPEDYIGIATDGDHICFAFHKNGSIRHRNLIPFNEASIGLVAQACVDSKRRAVTADNLVEDFGNGSEIGRNMMSGLARELEQALKAKKVNKTKMLFEEWRTLFGQVADLSAAQAAAIKRQIPLELELEKDDAVSALLFVVHTYNAFVMKLLAAEIVAEYGLTAHRDFCEHLLGLEDDALLTTLDTEIERSAYFEAARVKGFVEEAIFSWYTDPTLSLNGRKSICDGIRPFLTQLALYRMDDLSAARSRDLLKAFYQALVPETLRKALGEFYTPDWLVDVACDRAAVQDWGASRVLDPTCGSGSFLLEAIRRKREVANQKGDSASDTLKRILDTVWGFDLNPLAVQASRVNFLIAIADLVGKSKMEVELPVLLADAVYSPAHSPQVDKEFVEYRIGSAQSDLQVVLPWKLAHDRRRLDGVFAIMAEAVEEERSYQVVEKALLNGGLLSREEAEAWKSALKGTYGRVLDLHKKAWNGIWFRIVRNFFWSAVAGEFDVVIGNPPWVRWSNLPEMYRKRIKPTCEQYAIFSETPFHGGNELDISGMLTYTVGDKWLRQGGTLVFVITQTHFQSPSSQGFRSFKVNEEANLVPVAVDDLKRLKPFSKVANKTAIMRLVKVTSDKKPAYPVPYTVWDKAERYAASIPEDLSKEEVLKRVERKEWEANPVDGGNSPWAILPKGRFADMIAIQGSSDWIAGRKGVTADLNGIYMVAVLDVNEEERLVQVETRPAAGRTAIGPAKRYWIEPDLLHPLLKGAGDFSACQLHVEGPPLYFIVPNQGITRAHYDEAERMLTGLENTSRYFKAYKKLLSNRSTYRLRQKAAPYYAVYNVGAYSFAPYKVIWAEQSTRFEAAVVSSGTVPLVGSRPYVPDHKIYFADFDNENEAFFVCALLNSLQIREYVESHTIQIQVSNIFKHVSIPRYDASDADHMSAVDVCKKAHASPDEKSRKKYLEELGDLTHKILMAGKRP